MSAFGWLNGRNDRQLAETAYAGRESASARAARLRRANHKIRVNRDGDKAGTEPRRRFGWT
ncbi:MULTISPECIES: hypothetical protein [unclassified Streptomyces]|uniref:hypothetical protein n=1 Tax=unclassified Streptomyces TaxID=2593676 RepID=UPI00093DF8BB|nr:hypothetical protein [Streptomyces sp. TSRI0281]OKI34989.1 hypothetical protein A6A29_16320 [Streptomyces sp. TSRI0281]